ncbi:Rieske 2Fe-2S domain-containing protein [Herbaspirillum lusitanum]|uniref:Rieske 2Fe-2S domain-containing protein n=1 Tax=Herbaspirillum lusitanum TaxID=213312 RepID=UPI0002FBC384|nr:Rieske 2Fe-2S domain-containing protein [Herbaspirillum lusitanum]
MESTINFVDDSLLKKVPSWRDYLAAKVGFRNHWYPIKLSREIGESQVVKATVCGENILLKRIDGKVFAIRDRCIHRGVPLSEKLECYSKGTITCWYHGFTYKWENGELCDILASPDSRAIGRRSIKTYPVEEAKGVVFVFVGDIDTTPHPLSEDVPPMFLDADMALEGDSYMVDSNWRVGCENGFDGLHVYIHRTSPLVNNTQRSLPIGHTAQSGKIELLEEDGKPKGVYDAFAHHDVLWDGSVEGEVVVKGVRSNRTDGAPTRTTAASLWLPGVLRVDDFPDQDRHQFEWYVPVTEDTHYYLIMIGKRVSNKEEEAEHVQEFWNRWKRVSLDGFNNQDIEARLALQKFYKRDRAWLEEILIEGDHPIVKWRELCHRHNRGVQSPDNL